MKRRIAGILCITVVFLVACGNPGEEPVSPQSMTPAHTPSPQSVSQSAGSGDTVDVSDGANPAAARDDETATAVPASATPTVPPTETPVSTATASATPAPSPTSVPPLRRLTTGACCTQPFWSPDSERVLYIDAPPPGGQLGIWGVDVTGAAREPEVFTEQIGFYTDDFEYRVDPLDDTTVIEQLSSGERWNVPANGNIVYLSPDRTRVVWNESDPDVPFEERTTEVWVANIDGSDVRRITVQRRGGFSGWLSNDTILLSGRESFQSEEETIVAYSLSDGSSLELIREERVRGTSLSPDGQWLVYYIAQNRDPAKNGIWLVRIDGADRHKLELSLFGAYKWRDSSRLLIVPFNPNVEYHELWQYDIETRTVRQLTDAETTPFKIANGDWTVSPDGTRVAFVEASDRNIWVLELRDG